MKAAWNVVPLGHLCFITSGKSDTKDAIEDGEYAFFDRSRVIKRSSRFLYDCDALIIPGEGTEFLPKHFTGKFDLHQRAYALFNFKSELNIRFLYYYLHHLSDYFPRVAVGATVKSLRRRHFEELPVALTNLHEQMRIVAILDEAFEGIDTAVWNAEKNIDNSQSLFRDLCYEVFRPKNNECRQVSLGELCRSVEYGTASKSTREGRVPVLRMGNIQSGRIDWTDLAYTNNSDEITRYALKPGDVLFNRTNSAEHVGKSAIYRGEKPAIFAGYLIRILRKEDLLDAEFLNYFLNSSIARDYGKTVMSQSVNQANINGSKLKDYPISVPSLSEQMEIVEKLHAVQKCSDELCAIYRLKAAALSELKRSLLSKAFAGELTEKFAEAVQNAAA